MWNYIKHVSVLTFDDQDFIRMLIRQTLKEMGYLRIKEALNVNDTWAGVVISQPNIIIADWVMQPSNRLEFTHKIRRHPKSLNPLVPIIRMTGHTKLDRVIESIDSGINEYVIKPLSAKSLIVGVQSVIEAHINLLKPSRIWAGPSAPFSCSSRRPTQKGNGRLIRN